MVRIHFAIALILGSGIAWVSASDAGAPNYRAVQPRWRVDLRAAIGSPPLPYVFPGQYEIRGSPVISLWFSDESTVVVSFVIASSNLQFLNRNSIDKNSPMQLRAVFLDAPTGKVIATSDWPTNSRTSAIVAAHDGTFVTQTGSELILNSRTAKDIKSLRLPPESSWRGYSSPSGEHALLIGQRSLGSQVPWVWVNVDDLTVVKQWQDVQSGWVSISDHMIAMTACLWIQDCARKVVVKGPNTDWNTIVSSDQHHRPFPQFISDNLLVLRDFPDRLKVIKTNGNPVLTEEMDRRTKNQGWGRAYVSANGHRFVIPADVIKGRIAALDVSGHGVLKEVLVYDAPFESRSYTLELKPRMRENDTLFALSPDGSKLAILDNQLVELFDLPRPPH